MSRDLELETDEGIIFIDDWKTTPGRKASSSHWENGLDNPPEPPEIYEYRAIWKKTGAELTPDEIRRFNDGIEEAIIRAEESGNYVYEGCSDFPGDND